MIPESFSSSVVLYNGRTCNKSVMQVFSLVNLRSGWPRRPKKIVAWKMRKRTLPSTDSVRSNFTVPNIMLRTKSICSFSKQVSNGIIYGGVTQWKHLIVVLAPVVQTSDSAIHRINHYPADSVIDFRNTAG